MDYQGEQHNIFCFALDLKNDPEGIEAYVEYHKKVWPEILDSLKEAGVVRAEIYHVFNRLFLILEGDGSFSLDRKAAMDACNPKVQEWEKLMWNYQQALPNAPKGAKWMLMDKIFEFKNN